MIEVTNLSRRYEEKVAIDSSRSTFRRGVISGFLGQNRAGKSTTTRTIRWLDRSSSGEAWINGRRCGQRDAPLREIGALLDAEAIRPGRSAYHHLLTLNASNVKPGIATGLLGLRGAGKSTPGTSTSAFAREQS